MPISKYFKLIKRSYNDFDVIQVTKVSPLPQIPKFTFDKKGGAYEASNESNDISADRSPLKANENEKPLEAHDKHPKAEADAAEQSEGGKFQSGKTHDKEGDKDEHMPLKIDEEQKRTGCHCIIL